MKRLKAIGFLLGMFVIGISSYFAIFGLIYGGLWMLANYPHSIIYMKYILFFHSIILITASYYIFRSLKKEYSKN